MAYTNSPLVSYTKLSPNHSGQRTHSIDRITPHCVVGQCSVETLGNIMYPTSRQAAATMALDLMEGLACTSKKRTVPGVPLPMPTTRGPSPLNVLLIHSIHMP